MKPILIIFTLFVSIIITQAGFSPQDIHEVRAYVYDYTQEEDNKTLLKNGKLHKGVINQEGSKLNPTQIKRLIAALRTKKKDDFGALCYMPHHGFVFYNKQGKAIGHLELCFQCGNVDSSPKKLAARPWDWIEMKKLLEETKIPILKKDEEYTKLYLEQQKKENKILR
ncbi:hypothetical protein OAB00_03680 [Akkermansiaceae bacterium]|nr:hypothetical protein [Akkermansiaceae bacterium]